MNRIAEVICIVRAVGKNKIIWRETVMTEWSDPLAIVGTAQVMMAFVLAIFTLLLWRSTSEYAGQVKDQTDCMKKNIELMKDQANMDIQKMGLMRSQVEMDTRINRYNRLRDEMDKLVAPLYFATLTSDVLRKNWGFFRLLNPIQRWEKPEYHELFAFWDGIKKNLHLCQNKKLLKYLTNHFLYNDDYFRGGQTEGAKTNFEKNLRELIDEINQHGYPQLQKQIENAEKELGIRRDNH